MLLKLEELTNDQLLNGMQLDYTIFKLNHRVWNNSQAVWAKWIRSN